MFSIDAWLNSSNVSCPEASSEVSPALIDPCDPKFHSIPFRHIKLKVEGKFLYTNTGLLSLVSPVFRSMFSHDFKESRSDELELPDKSYEAVLALLNCVQLCTPPEQFITQENVVALLSLSKEYQVGLLWSTCLRYLKNFLTEENVIRYFSEVKAAKIEELEYVLVAEIIRYYPSIAKLEQEPHFQQLDSCTRQGLKTALAVLEETKTKEVEIMRRKFELDMSRLRHEMVKLRRERMALIFQHSGAQATAEPASASVHPVINDIFSEDVFGT